jgi:molybdopterin converting factor small subunit
MIVHLEYAAQARRVAGTGRESLEIGETARLCDLFAHAAAGRGEEFARLLFKPDGSVQLSLLVFVNDRQTPADSAAALEDGDVVTVMSPISGG